MSIAIVGWVKKNNLAVGGRHVVASMDNMWGEETLATVTVIIRYGAMFDFSLLWSMCNRD